MKTIVPARGPFASQRDAFLWSFGRWMAGEGRLIDVRNIRPHGDRWYIHERSVDTSHPGNKKFRRDARRRARQIEAEIDAQA